MNFSGPTRIKKTTRWFMFLVLIVSSFSFYHLYRYKLFSYSTITFIPKFQKFSKMYLGETLEWVIKITQFLGSEKLYGILLLIIYNYGNIYKTYFIFSSISVSMLILSILKIAYSSPRPFWYQSKTLKIEVLDCQGGYGAPSAHIYNATVFYLTLWKLLFQSKSREKKKCLKFLVLLLCLFCIVLVGLNRVLTGAHSIDQVIFGFLLGLSYHVLVFHVLHIFCNNNRQILEHIKISPKKICNFLLYFLPLISAYLGIYYYRANDKDFQRVLSKNTEIIHNLCPKIPRIKMLLNESTIFFTIFFGNVGAFLGMGFEYKCLFEKNDNNWSQYNFEMEDLKGNEQEVKLVGQSQEIQITKETQWNHTGTLKSIGRFVVILLFMALFSLSYIYSDWNDNFWKVLLCKICLTLNLYSFGIFFLVKQFCKWFKLTNITLFTMIRDSF